MRLLLLCTGVLFLTACTRFPMTVTSPRGVLPRPSNCDVQFANDAPKSGYEEIAILTHDGLLTSNLETFKSHVRGDVCAIGGEIVVARRDDHGDITGGSVYRRDANAAATNVGSAPPPNDTRMAPTN